jgi:hypothetical protein
VKKDNVCLTYSVKRCIDIRISKNIVSWQPHEIIFVCLLQGFFVAEAMSMG